MLGRYTLSWILQAFQPLDTSSRLTNRKQTLFKPHFRALPILIGRMSLDGQAGPDENKLTDCHFMD